MGATYMALRSRFRDRVGGHETILHWFRITRYLLVQGPWQPWLIRLYQRGQPDSAPPPVRDDSLVSFEVAASAVEQLHREAYAPGFTLPEELVDEIATFAKPFAPKRIDEPHLRSESVLRVATDPGILAVARGYLRAEPILLETKIFWTKPNSGPTRAGIGIFHYDLSDIRALKIYVYLTDVDEASSPHIVVRGSHRRKLRQILTRFISDEQAQATYGEDRIHTILGKRGTGWFEDVTCFHKQALGQKVRLILTIIYSLHRRPVEDQGRTAA